jgi:predicted nucleic acid-binding protein
MKVFADTNFFTNLWVELSQSDQANVLYRQVVLAGVRLPVTRLIRMELTNALQRLVFEARHGTQSFRVSNEMALAARGILDSELMAGLFFEWCPISDDELETTFESLAYRYTATEGFRTYDIMHVASALVLGCDTFWSFDERANKLAKLVGLQTFS